MESLFVFLGETSQPGTLALGIFVGWGEVSVLPRSGWGPSPFPDRCNLVGGGEGCSHSCRQLWFRLHPVGPPRKWFSCCLLFGSPALGISYTAPHPSRHRAVCPSFEGGLRKVPWVSLGWATPSPAHQPGPVSLRLPKGAGKRNSCRQAGWAAPSRSSVPQLWHLQAPGQWPPSGDTAAGGCDTASCVQAPEWGRGPQHPPGAQRWGWKAKSVLPL